MTRFTDSLQGSRRWRGLLAPLSLVVVGVLFLLELATLAGVPVARDMQLFFLPHKHIVWEALQEGRLPLWTHQIGNGFPTLANFQSGVFYPPHWLYAAGGFLAVFNWILILHLVLGGLFVYLFCRGISFGRPASWAAAVTFMLGGFFVSLTNLINVLQAAAWAPGLCLVTVRHVRLRRLRSFLLLVAAYLLAFLAGAPEVFVLGSAVAVLYTLVHLRQRRGSLRDAGVLAGSMALAAAAVAGLAAVQILPTLELVQHSLRGQGLVFEEASRYSLAPVRLLHLVLPNDFSDPAYRFGDRLQLTSVEPWLYSVYLGVVPLAVAAYAALDRARRKEVALWAGLSLTGLVLALGKHTPLFGWLHGFVPGASLFRFPEKFFLLTGLGFAMLVAHGFERALGPGRRGRGAGKGVQGLLLAALTAGLGAYLVWVLSPDAVLRLASAWLPEAPFLENFGYFYAEETKNLQRLLLLAGCAVAVLVLRRTGVLGARPATLLVLLALATDLWFAHRHLTPVVDPSFYREEPAVAETVPLEEVRLRYRYRATPFDENLGVRWSLRGMAPQVEKWLWQRTMQPSTGPLWRVQTHDSDDAIHLERRVDQEEILKALPDERRRWRVLELSSVRYLYSMLHHDTARYDRRERLEGIPGFVYRVQGAVPRAYLARPRFFADPVEALNGALGKDFDPRGEVALVGSGDDAGPGSGGSGPADTADVVASSAGRTRHAGGGPAGGEDAGGRRGSRASRAEIVADRGSEVRVEIRPDTSAYLVLTDFEYPGWEARADGEVRTIRRANYFYRAVRVEPGDREVVFRYRPRSFARGKRISLASLLLVLAGAAGWRFRRRGSARAGRRNDEGATPVAAEGGPSAGGTAPSSDGPGGAGS